FVGAWRYVQEDFSAANPLKPIYPENWSDSEINFMSYAQPIEVGNSDVVLSVNYHQVYDFAVEFNRNETTPLSPLAGSTRQMVDREDGKSKGAISAYTLAGGLSMPDWPEISIGVGINWYAQSLLNDYAWQVKKTTTGVTLRDPGPDIVHTPSTSTETFDDVQAHNFTLGLLWDAYEKQENLLTFGLVCHTPFTVGVHREVYRVQSDDSEPNVVDESMDIDFPLSLGAGLNYRFSDSLSAAFDVEWKEWSKFTQKHSDGTEISRISDDTLAYRLGGEYLFLDSARESVLACRGGVFYEPRPAWDKIVPVYGFSAGLGWTLREQFSLDFAYQYRWGEEDLGNIDYKIKEDFFVLSLIRYF
nr:outer membrane protein transport protein [Chloroflexota bacterium]